MAQIINLSSSLPVPTQTVNSSINGIDTLDPVWYKHIYNMTLATSQLQSISSVPMIVTSLSGTSKSVAVSLKTPQGSQQSGISLVQAYLSDNADGSTIIATAPNGTVTATTGQLWDINSAKKVFTLITNSTGFVTLTINNTGSKTLYVVVSLPTGAVQVSPPIIF